MLFTEKPFLVQTLALLSGNSLQAGRGSVSWGKIGWRPGWARGTWAPGSSNFLHSVMQFIMCSEGWALGPNGLDSNPPSCWRRAQAIEHETLSPTPVPPKKKKFLLPSLSNFVTLGKFRTSLDSLCHYVKWG